eukprot:36091_1
MVRIKHTNQNGKEPCKKQPKKNHSGKQNINNLLGNSKSIIPGNVDLQSVIMNLEESDLDLSEIENESETVVTILITFCRKTTNFFKESTIKTTPRFEIQH